jgi:hypothetical protein
MAGGVDLVDRIKGAVLKRHPHEIRLYAVAGLGDGVADP